MDVGVDSDAHVRTLVHQRSEESCLHKRQHASPTVESKLDQSPQAVFFSWKKGIRKSWHNHWREFSENSKILFSMWVKHLLSLAMKMFKIFSLGAMIAAVSAQTSWWTDPKAVVTAANVEFATFFNAGNFTACAGTWVQRSHCYTILLFFCIYLNITNMYRSDTCAQCTPWSTGTARPSFYRCLMTPRTHPHAHINTLSFPFRYTENGAHYTGKGFVVGREAIAATWQAAAKGGLANVSFVTVEAIANQDANTIHEYGVATSNQWTDVKYFL